MIIVECSFSKSSLFKMFSNSFGLKSVLEKLSFCYRLEWTVSLAVESPFKVLQTGPKTL